jgi:hypothetical protein
MRGLELQLTHRAQVIDTAKGQALTIRFAIGPFSFFIIAGLPESMGRKNEGPLVYIKVQLIPNDDWPVFKDHDKSGETPAPRRVSDKG